MSLLGNMFKSAFSASRAPGTAAAAPVPPSERVAPDTQARKPAGYVWESLSGSTGTQQMHYPHMERADVRQLLGHAPRRVLDIGCATGAVGDGLKKAYPGCWVWGCELNPETAAMAGERLDLVTTEPWERWGPKDFERLRGVDTVMLLDVLEHMYNPWGLLRLLSQHLAADAQVIVSLPNIGHFEIMRALASGVFPYHLVGILDITHIRFFTRHEMLAMFEQTGFRVGMDIRLSMSEAADIPNFPAQVSVDRLTLNVASKDEWLALNTVQFGFRLGVAAPGPTSRQA